jgi:ABC-type amino acid transport system permease subunit
MSDLPLTGEVSNSKLAAVFDTEAAARAAAAAVIAQTELQPAQVKVVTPDEPHPGIKLEPEGGGILRTIVVAHVWLGVAGVLAGIVAFVVAAWSGVPFIVQSPWAAGLAMAAFGGVGGLLLGGLVSLRPDHDPYVLATREAMAQRRTTVLVHALNAQQLERANAILAASGADVTRTL